MTAGGLSRRLRFTLSRRASHHQPSKLVKMMPQHQVPAADPDPERLDETQVKTIQAKVNNNHLSYHAPRLACLVNTAAAIDTARLWTYTLGPASIHT